MSHILNTQLLRASIGTFFRLSFSFRYAFDAQWLFTRPFASD